MSRGPIEDSYWIEPGKLLAGEYPGARDEGEARHKLRRLLDAGITLFIDLTEAGEYGLKPYASLLPGEAAIPAQAIPAEAENRRQVEHRLTVLQAGTPLRMPWQCPATICTRGGWFTQTVDGAFTELGSIARCYEVSI